MWFVQIPVPNRYWCECWRRAAAVWGFAAGQEPAWLEAAHHLHLPSHPAAQRHFWLQSFCCSSAGKGQQLCTASEEKTKRWVFVRCERGNYYCFLTCLWALVTYTPWLETLSNTHLKECEYNLLHLHFIVSFKLSKHCSSHD